MPKKKYPKFVKCKLCGRRYLAYKKADLRACFECRIERVKRNVMALREHQGEEYLRWLNSLRYATKRLEEE